MSPALLLIALAATQTNLSLGERRARLPKLEGTTVQTMFPIGKTTPRYTIVADAQDKRRIVAEDFSNGRRQLWSAPLEETRENIFSGTVPNALLRTSHMAPWRPKPGSTEAERFFRGTENLAVYGHERTCYAIAFAGGKRIEGRFIQGDEVAQEAFRKLLRKGKAWPVTMGEQWLMSGGAIETEASRKLAKARDSFFNRDTRPPLTLGEVTMAGAMSQFPAGRADVCFAYGNRSGGGTVIIAYRKSGALPRVQWTVKVAPTDKPRKNVGTLVCNDVPYGRIPRSARTTLTSKGPFAYEIVSAMAEEKSYGIATSDGRGEGGYMNVNEDQINGFKPSVAPVTLAELWLLKKAKGK